MTQDLAIVFGGSRGIGRAIVESLLDDGHAVAWTSRAGVVSRQLRPDERAYPADVRDAAAVAHVFEQAAADFGARPSCVVANAGIMVRVAVPGGGAYTASKAAVESLMRSMSFLVSKRASWVHGQVLQPNGGMV